MTEQRVDGMPESSTAQDVERLGELADGVVPALVARLRASRLGEMEIRSGGWRVRLRRGAPRSVPAPGGTRGTSFAASDDVPSHVDSGMARSPGVGYFSPHSDLLPGQPVRAGDPLGSVDVLGVMQDVTAPVDGVVSRVYAEPGQAVEYGQELAAIDALGSPTGDDGLPADTPVTAE